MDTDFTVMITNYEVLLYIIFFTMLMAAFLVGRIHGMQRRRNGENTVETLDRIIADKKQHIDELRKDQEYAVKEGIRAQEKIGRWDEIKADHENLKNMREELKAFENQENNRIDELERRRAEMASRLREIQTLLDQYPIELTKGEEVWDRYINGRKEKYDDLNKELSELEERKDELEAEIQNSKKEIDNLNLKRDDVQSELNELQAKLQQAEKDLEDIEKKAEAIDAVSNAVIQFPEDSLNVAIKEFTDSREQVGDKLGSFRDTPACLEKYSEPMPEDDVDEESLLDNFEAELKNVGLNYHRRIIRAFHTALKVNDLSPLTVLSGLSGTGKSQLPRAYASFFGMNFLHVPIEPGWDSPQDILGFYDFVAKQYRPTDRARALGRFDKEFAQAVGIDWNTDWNNRILLILLDEMNLARTEYYFSEFLSRLEMRGPRQFGEVSKDDRRDAEIAIEMPYAENEDPMHLYVPHNVLWVGTLNEDETTQALSDKVLDRANSIRFAPPKPEKLIEHSAVPKKFVDSASGYLPYKTWLNWSENKNKPQTAEINQTLENLADNLQSANRGFGFRITQSIKAYIDRYPGQDWKIPMIDQINMRLLPKLSGTELQECQDAVETIKRRCEEDLRDEAFAAAIDRAIQESQHSQTFTWSGYTYEI